MTPIELEELARLRIALDDIEQRVQDAIDSLYRVHEAMRDAKVTLTLIEHLPSRTHTVEPLIATRGPLS